MTIRMSVIKMFSTIYAVLVWLELILSLWYTEGPGFNGNSEELLWVESRLQQPKLRDHTGQTGLAETRTWIETPGSVPAQTLTVLFLILGLLDPLTQSVDGSAGKRHSIRLGRIICMTILKKRVHESLNCNINHPCRVYV